MIIGDDAVDCLSILSLLPPWYALSTTITTARLNSMFISGLGNSNV